MYSLWQAKDYDPSYAKWSDLPLPFFPSKYQLKIREGVNRDTHKSTGQPDPWTLNQLKIVKELFKQSEYIISATDDDREGQLIFAYVYEELGVNVPYKRLSIDSMTQAGIIKSFNELKDSSEVHAIEDAGRGRNIADWVVGANLTAAMTLKYGNGQLLSIGRVQTPTLAIIVKRELEIKNFKSHPFWTIIGKFTTSNGENYEGKYSEAQIEDKSKAEQICNKLISSPDGVIESCTTEATKKNVPLLYNLTALSIDANAKYGFTAQQTLDLAQELYMAGYITYPRTSSQHLTDDMHKYVDDVLDMLSNFGEYKPLISAVPAPSRNYTKNHFNSSKVESHFAIIPTNAKPSNLSDDQKKIYDLCARSLIRIIYKAAIINKTTIITDVNGEKFKTTGSVIVDAQWLTVNTSSKDDDIIPAVSQGDNVTGDFNLKEGKTKPPERYDDGSLLKVLRAAGKEIEDDDLRKIMMDSGDGGIGTEATRAGIIATVVSRYCTRKGKLIIPSEVGIKLIEILPVQDLKSPLLTAQFEDKLSDIANKKENLSDFISSIEESTAKWLNEITTCEYSGQIGNSPNSINSETNCICPKCGAPMKKYKWGWACSKYKKDDAESCKFAVSYTICGAKLSEKDIISLLTNKRTSFINGFKGKNSDTTFGAFVVLNPDNSIGFSWDLPQKCPICGKPLSISSKAWSCSGYKEGCKFAIWNTIAGKKISDKDKEAILTNGKTKLLSGFTSKAGKSFDAFLVLKDGKIEFEFPPSKRGGKSS